MLPYFQFGFHGFGSFAPGNLSYSALIPTFITCSLLTCSSAFLDVSSIGICRTPIVTGQMANSVALLAFGSTWTIMVVVAFRTQRLRSAIMFLLPVPCSVSSAIILSLVRLLLVLIVLKGVIQLPLVLSLAYNKSVDLFFLSIGLAH
nr:hypothetical protein [Tanacetum cinerariifolium]